MTDKPNFVQNLLAAMRASRLDVKGYKVNLDNGRVEPVDKAQTNKLIHSKVDLGLMNALSQWLESQEVTEATAISTLAFMLASHIHHSTFSEAEGCEISIDFENYIHDSVHLLHQEHGLPKKR